MNWIIYAGPFSNAWVVRDGEEQFWIVYALHDGWEHRKPFTGNQKQLREAPGYCKMGIGLPKEAFQNGWTHTGLTKL